MRELRHIVATPTRVLFEVVSDRDDLDGATLGLVEIACGPELPCETLIRLQHDDDWDVDVQVRPS